jgi:hypothetical protein
VVAGHVRTTGETSITVPALASWHDRSAVVGQDRRVGGTHEEEGRALMDTSEGRGASGEVAAAAPTAPPVTRRMFAVWVTSIVTVVYIAMIGIFAIEEINSRDATARLLVVRQTEVLGRLAQGSNGGAGGAPGTDGSKDQPAKKDPALERERKRLEELQTRLAILITDGAASLGTSATLRGILCELDKIDEEQPICPAAERPTSGFDKTVAFLSTFFLKDLGAESATGAILAILIVTAAFGGALIQLSLDRDGEDILRTCLRAIGGGIVCYLVVVGGGVPLATVDLEKPSNPATASLLGLLSGMFSNKLFQLVSDFVEAFVKKVTPNLVSDPAKDGDARVKDGKAKDAEVATASAAAGPPKGTPVIVLAGAEAGVDGAGDA